MIAKARKPLRRRNMAIERLGVDVPRELKEIVGKESDKTGETLNDVVTRVLAEHIGRPDLAEVPRAKPGRPRKKISAA